MKARYIPVKGSVEVANGHCYQIRHIAYVNVIVGNSSQVIACVVMEGLPTYSIILGKHWMASVGTKRDYARGIYMLLNDQG